MRLFAFHVFVVPDSFTCCGVKNFFTKTILHGSTFPWYSCFSLNVASWRPSSLSKLLSSFLMLSIHSNNASPLLLETSFPVTGTLLIPAVLGITVFPCLVWSSSCCVCLLKVNSSDLTCSGMGGSCASAYLDLNISAVELVLPENVATVDQKLP